jgi:beta-lactamase class A
MNTEKSPNNPHSHLYTIADDDAVQTLVQKLETAQIDPSHRERLRASLDSAREEYRATNDVERKAFFHGMLTGMAVALNIDRSSDDSTQERKTA